MRAAHLATAASVTLSILTVALAPGCQTEGCLAGQEGCEVPSPCTELAFECSDTSVELIVIADPSEVPGGLDSTGAVGDFLMRNARVEVVIDAVEQPSGFAPSGGTIIDMANRDRDDDSLVHVFQGVGALPSDQVTYKTSRAITGDGFVALQFDGHLIGDVRQRAYTRYELRGCEPGVRVRTEIINGGDDTVVWSTTDAYQWGGRSMMPFTPTPGEGYVHPTFGLGTINDVFVEHPFVVGASHSDPASAVATVPCNIENSTGFHSGQVSTSGTKRRIVPPRDYDIYERVIAVRPGAGAQPGVDIALEYRRQLFDEAFATIGGRIALEGGRADAVGDHSRAAVQIYEGALEDPRGALVPWTEVVPRADGTFEARVPASRSYVVEVVAFGATAAVAQVDAGTGAVDIGTLSIAAAGDVTIDVTVDGAGDHALVMVTPGDDETAARVTTKYFGTGPDCAPQLGPPFGPSPACNRVLVDGPTTIDLPTGKYDFYATVGPFASLQKITRDVGPASSQSISFSLATIPPPAGTLSADFHVHGAASYDSVFPDLDRVRAFLAARIDVIAATDHDSVWDYASAMDALNADARMVLIPGVESSQEFLHALNPSVYFPQVIGHWNFWPLPFDDAAPRNGAPWDELIEPGVLFERAAARGWDVVDGVVQMNHPWTDLEFGRDLGFARALGLRFDREVPRVFDGTGPSMYLRTPEGASFSNGDFHAQEVGNSSDLNALLSNRALWFWQLHQGIVRAGTSNSDSHTLTDNVLGSPRNLVTTTTTVPDFDLATFNADVRAGHMIGTNGPIIDAFISDEAAALNRPSVVPFEPAPDAALHINVHAVAWVPVREVRVILNGEAVRVFGEDELVTPADPGAAVDVVRLNETIPLTDLLPSGNLDAWIVIEAGDPLPSAEDLDCDGVPDTTDNNFDGVIDFRDVERNGDGVVDATDSESLSEPEKCDPDRYGSTSSVDRPGFGPLRNPPPPARDDPNAGFYIVTPGGFPFAFTNPFILDVSGDGVFSGPGIP